MDVITHSPGDILRGHFRIEGIVGTGAFGMVYRATDLNTSGSVWAIKEIWEANLNDDERREALELFRKEVGILTPDADAEKGKRRALCLLRSSHSPAGDGTAPWVTTGKASRCMWTPWRPQPWDCALSRTWQIKSTQSSPYRGNVAPSIPFAFKPEAPGGSTGQRKNSTPTRISSL